MDEVTSMLQRMRNPSAAICQIVQTMLMIGMRYEAEYKQLTTEINPSQAIPLLGAEVTERQVRGSFQVGADAGRTISFKMTTAFSMTGIADATKAKASVTAITSTNSTGADAAGCF